MAADSVNKKENGVPVLIHVDKKCLKPGTSTARFSGLTSATSVEIEFTVTDLPPSGQLTNECLGRLIVGLLEPYLCDEATALCAICNRKISSEFVSGEGRAKWRSHVWTAFNRQKVTRIEAYYLESCHAYQCTSQADNVVDDWYFSMQQKIERDGAFNTYKLQK